MKKRRLLTLFFGVHIIMVFFQAFWSTIDMYWEVHYNKKVDIPILNFFKINQHTEPYYLLTGIDTGYGFYGIKTSTEKYFRCTFLDSSNNVIKRDRYFNLTTSNAISRLESYASYMANYISDTGKLIELETTDEDILEAIQLRKQYVTKLFKWLGKPRAASTVGCKSYTIELLTVVPKDIRNQSPKSKPELYVVKEQTFQVL